jgi:uncharacterized membrane protein
VFKLHRIWRHLDGKLWVRPTFWSLAAIAVALLAALANRWKLPAFVPDIEQSSLQGLLTIIASSMLTVSTFSLSILVSAFATASSSATPRATRLVMADESAQHAISSFIAAFIFSMVALTALGLGYYGETGRFVLLVFTIYVLGYLILALLRWIDTLSKIGRMSHTITTVELAALPPLRSWHLEPALGGNMDALESEPQGVRVHGGRTGYLQYIDMASLQRAADAADTLLHVRVRPGDFLAPSTVLAIVAGASDLDADQIQQLADAFLVGRDRTEEQDPRFGLVILSEIAQRALSPAVNDPGTAMLVTGVIARLLIDGTAVGPDEEVPEVRFPRISVVPLDQHALVRDVIEPIARDGANCLEVALALLDRLALVAENARGDLQTAARTEAATAMDHALHGLRLPRERETLQVRARTLGLSTPLGNGAE